MDKLRERFLAREWAVTTPCDKCPSGHATCLLCGGLKPLVSLDCFPLERFGHQKRIRSGDYPEDCIYMEVEDSMRWTLEGMDDDAERQRLAAICKGQGHEQGAESIGTMHTETVAITPKYECRRCGATYTGKKRPVRKGDFAPSPAERSEP